VGGCSLALQEFNHAGAVVAHADVLISRNLETVEEALTAIARRVASVQIIINAFRQKPLDKVLPAAIDAEVGILARVPLASGLLSGRYSHDTQFASNDHRFYNRHGEAFDVGETFSGVDFDTGVEAAREFAALVPPGVSSAQLALRWIVDQPGVTAVIPGAHNVQQARDNATVDELGPLDAAVRTRIASFMIDVFDHPCTRAGST
jgi:aryl-alcohol dehydrogenase-like predicted oxidoreductase